MVLCPVIKAELEEVDELEETNVGQVDLALLDQINKWNLTLTILKDLKNKLS